MIELTEIEYLLFDSIQFSAKLNNLNIFNKEELKNDDNLKAFLKAVSCDVRLYILSKLKEFQSEYPLPIAVEKFKEYLSNGVIRGEELIFLDYRGEEKNEK